MKLFLLINAILFIVSSSSQNSLRKFNSNTTSDSLRKYSYYIGTQVITGLTDSMLTITPTNGTGFFIRNSNHLFFVTAKHNITHCINGKKAVLLGGIFIWLQGADNKITQKITIDVEKLRETLQCLPQKSDTDAIVIPVENDLPVYSIEKFITGVPKKYEEVEMYGYPENPKDTLNLIDYESISNIHLPSNSYTFETLRDSITNSTDLVNSYIVSQKAPINDLLHGYSGAPVFMKNEKTKMWVFIGLNWGHGDFGNNDRYFELVRQDIILQLVQRNATNR